MERHDVLVIGSGSAGQTVAADCAAGGLRVAVVDRLPYGGTCALRGCQPKKLLLSAAEATGRTRDLGGKGVRGSCAIDWPELMARKRALIADTPASTEAWMRGSGIATLHGTARFVAEDAVEIDGERVSADAIVLATGAHPVDLGIEGAELALTSTDFLDLDEMPRRLAFLGGGYISFEFAWLAHLAGAQVTIVHRSASVLKGFDPVLADALAARYRTLGIRVLTESPVQRIERVPDGSLRVITPAETIACDAAVHGAGREPDLAALDLDAGNVAHSRHGVSVDAHLRSPSNPRVWACGDAAALGSPLTPVAGAQGQVVARGILGHEETFTDEFTPSVVFSDPPLARAGLGRESADGNESLQVSAFDMSGWFTQSRVGNTAAGAVIVSERETGLVRGAHLLGVSADEVINVFALAMRAGVTIDTLKTMMWSYPTSSYDINYLTGRW